jgi:hypothetical protein
MTSNGLDWSQISSACKFNTIKYSGKYFYGYSNSNNFLISKDGITWNPYIVDNMSPTSSIYLLGNTLFIANPNYDFVQNQYISKLYYSSINNTLTIKN